MRKILFATPLFALAACAENKVDGATCYVDLTDPANVTVEIKSDATKEILVQAKNFELLGNGNKQASGDDVAINFHNGNIPTLTLRFTRKECRLSLISHGYTYPMELAGAAPKPPMPPQ